jgi:hypothetical protein
VRGPADAPLLTRHFLVALARLQDLLFCAKLLFVAAKIAWKGLQLPAVLT